MWRPPHGPGRDEASRRRRRAFLRKPEKLPSGTVAVDASLINPLRRLAETSASVWAQDK